MRQTAIMCSSILAEVEMQIRNIDKRKTCNNSSTINTKEIVILVPNAHDEVGLWMSRIISDSTNMKYVTASTE
jgi:hypothetical protein